MYNLEEIAPATYRIPKAGGMRVPGLLIATQELLADMEIQKPLEQVVNVAHLPGIVGYSIAMPDIHWGYGFPIGGVAATEKGTGVISPGGVGYDINCGVRLAIVPIPYAEIDQSSRENLIKKLFELIPTGVGHGHRDRRGLTASDYRDLVHLGSKWSIQQGFGFEEDLSHCESNGMLAGGDLEAVSETARARGKEQLGSVGSGNHFVEVGEVQVLYQPEVAHAWGIEQGLTYVLIHSGSRGFGHQICQDTLDIFVEKGFARGLPDRQLVAAPLSSQEGQTYFAAMAAAANYAFNNRQQLLYLVRKAFNKVLKIDPQHIRLIYDVCHNIAKFEEHTFEGKKMNVCVHRKGATRAYGPGAPELNPLYQKTGQPVLVPGDMGRASHLMVGCGNPLTWSSACHGAGRARSRVQSLKHWAGRDPIQAMWKEGVKVMATSNRTLSEEMPDAYKDVDLVVKAVDQAGLAKMVARLKPGLVIKG